MNADERAAADAGRQYAEWRLDRPGLMLVFLGAQRRRLRAMLRETQQSLIWPPGHSPAEYRAYTTARALRIDALRRAIDEIAAEIAYRQSSRWRQHAAQLEPFRAAQVGLKAPAGWMVDDEGEEEA